MLREAVFFRSSCHSGCTVLANRAGWRVAGETVEVGGRRRVVSGMSSDCMCWDGEG